MYRNNNVYEWGVRDFTFDYNILAFSIIDW
jgi:hypothetical protein